MKKILAVLAAVMAAVMVFSGCSANELGFYSTLKSMSALTDYSYKGSVSVKINKLSSKSDNDTMATVKALLNKGSITYDGTFSTKTNKATLNLTAKSGNGLYTLPFKVILDNSGDKSLLSVSLPSMLESYVSYLPDEFKYTKVDIDGASYYQFDINAIIAQIKADAAKSGDASEAQTYASEITALTSITQITKAPSAVQVGLQKKALAFSDQLFTQYFKGLNLNLVKKSGSTYTVNTSINGLYSALVSTLTYIAKNTTSFKAMLVTALNSLSDDELALIGMTKDQKAEAIKEINSLTAKQINTAIASMNKSVNPMLSGVASGVKFTLQQNGSVYSSTFALSINNTKQKNADTVFDLSVGANSTITAA